MKRWWACCLCACVAACSNSEYGEYTPYPVSGQLLVNGEPAKGALIVFFLDGYAGDRTIRPQGWTTDEGKFVLSTFSANDGAPAGDYHVTVHWPVTRKGFGLAPDKLGGKFNNHETTQLTARIEKTNNKLPPIELQVNLDEVKPTTRTIKKGINEQSTPLQ